MAANSFGNITQGERVRVRSRFDGVWAEGFEVAHTESVPGRPPRYRVRRVTDRVELPTDFGPDEVVPQEYPGFRAQFWPGLPWG